MKPAPPLREGEKILRDHIPSLGVFKRSALVLIALTLPAVAVVSVVFPDSYWPAVPLFVTCLLLMQERVTLGKHRAWLTNRRIILQGGDEVPLGDILAAGARRSTVRVTYGGKGIVLKLPYSDNATDFAQAIEAARQGAV